MKRIVVLALALALAGCVNGQVINPFASFNNPLSKDSLAKLEAAYGAAASVALGYRNACAKGSIPAACKPIVKQIQLADRYAYNQIVVVRNFVKNNPTVDASSVIATAQQAVTAFQNAANGAN